MTIQVLSFYYDTYFEINDKTNLILTNSVGTIIIIIIITNFYHNQIGTKIQGNVQFLINVRFWIKIKI